MSTTPIDNTEDVIDSRDVIARIDELQAVVDDLREEFDANPANAGVDFDNWVRNQVGCSTEEADELAALKALAAQCEGYGDWGHGEALIREDHFVKYIEELIDDCYTLPKELTSGQWPYRHITIDYEAAAEEAKVDYTEVDFDGQTYFLRA